METHIIQGLFSESVIVYHYPSNKPSKKSILVLKGIYGEHDPNGLSWDNALVKLLQNNHHIIFIRTSRLNNKTDREAFIGKTFGQECSEIESALEYCNKNIFPKDITWCCIGASFGGTILLGTPRTLSQMKAVIMIGSGCGKTPETTKPLLSTLPETDQLLRALDTYSGIFIFLHGENDVIVPEYSQRLIYDRAGKHSNKHRWVSMPNLDHSLRDTSTKESYMAKIAFQYISGDFI